MSPCDHSHISAAHIDACTYVQQQCGGVSVLFNYMNFLYCDMSDAHSIGVILLVLWLLLLVSVLATTADLWFVPPLEHLSKVLKLSPPVAGITLLALGNGAPDLATAYAALNTQSDLALQLSALLGASIFISTVVMGSVLLTSPAQELLNVRRTNFFRDIIVYMVVVATVVGVAQDGKITLAESTSFLTVYVIYIGMVVWMTRKSFDDESQYTPIDEVIEVGAMNGSRDDDNDTSDDDDSTLEGFTWPTSSRGGHLSAKVVFLRIQWILELPFTVLRWCSCPSCTGKWDAKRRRIAIVSPIGLSIMLIIAIYGWKGFELTVGSSKMPVYALVLCFSVVISAWFAWFTTDDMILPSRYASVLALMAFVSAICWLNVIANEVVAVLETIGIAMDISSGILGLTVLAVGNSVGDLVADTSVARNGHPDMGFASTLGSPLLNDVLGLGISLTGYTIKHGHSYIFDTNSKNFNEVKLSWIVLGISLLSTFFAMPLQNFQPRNAHYSVYLYVLYVTFLTLSVLQATGYVTIFSN